MHILLVGGNFDDNGGRTSKIIDTIYTSLSNNSGVSLIQFFNGGYFDDIEKIISLSKYANLVLWFPNIPNTKEKIRNVKELYPNTILISSKRNPGGKYDLPYLVNHALGLKSNLLVEFLVTDDGIKSRILDPLGVCWCDYTKDFDLMIEKLIDRASELIKFTRVPSYTGGPALEIPDEKEFFEIIRGYANTFHNLINPTDGVTRFLGNASFRGFRCERGFPSFRHGDYIFVSQRNIDKRHIDREGFVATHSGIKDNQNCVIYYGDNKPSVDTPIQLKLYEYYNQIQYMIHSHVYAEGAKFTKKAVPCGALEEFEEIIKICPKRELENFSVNLIGHGSLVFVKDLEYLKNISYFGRPKPEFV